MTREIRGLEICSEEWLTRFYEDRGIKSNNGGFDGVEAVDYELLFRRTAPA